ncbi:MAG TPA: alpha/beta hydrolase [Syntrophobacteria bacterium]|nr:alpha/beta hydrolase [Syntrophobacteria bacterium]
MGTLTSHHVAKESPGEAAVVRRSVGQNGKSISYLAAQNGQVGTQPAILLLHGSGVSARSWTFQLQGLGHAFRVLAIDLPGHGESDPVEEATLEGYADAARGLLDALGTGPVIAAGHSLGGAVAQLFAARYPEMVRGLILLSTCVKLPETDGFLQRFWGYLPGFVQKVLFFSTAKKILFSPSASREAILLGMEELRACRPETILKDMAAAQAMDLHEVARELRVPTLILCGDRDKLTPPALSTGLSDLITGSRLLIVEAAGHMLPLEAPGRVNQEILDFVNSVAPREVRLLPLVSGIMKRSILRRLIEKVTKLFRRQ